MGLDTTRVFHAAVASRMAVEVITLVTEDPDVVAARPGDLDEIAVSQTAAKDCSVAATDVEAGLCESHPGGCGLTVRALKVASQQPAS